MYIDTHCHLFFEEFDPDRSLVITNAKKAGVKQYIVPGVDEFTSLQAVNLTQNFPGVIFAGIGYHPYEAQKAPDLQHIENIIKKNRRTTTDDIPAPSIVAIGECGLDYHIYKGEQAESKKDNQKKLFANHLKLSIAYNLPVIMHCRDAFADFFDVLDSVPTLPNGVIHCFSGGLLDLREAQKRNLFIGVDGNVTYNKQIQLTTKEAPLSKILLETDAPYLTPTPHRGTRNEPKYMVLTAAKVADIKQIDKAYLAQQTTKNAIDLFRLHNITN